MFNLVLVLLIVATSNPGLHFVNAVSTTINVPSLIETTTTTAAATSLKVTSTTVATTMISTVSTTINVPSLIETTPTTAAATSLKVTSTTVATTMTPKVTYGEECSSEEMCLYSLKCIANACSCESPTAQYFEKAHNTCKAKVTYGQECLSKEMCLYSLNCTSNVCLCESPSAQYFDKANNICKAKVKYGEECLSEEMCLNSLNCTSNVCLCESPTAQYFNKANSTCKAKVTYGEECLSEEMCLYSLNCTSNVCLCESPTAQYFDKANSTCKATLNGTCLDKETVNQCSDTNAVCINETSRIACHCKSLYAPVKNYCQLIPDGPISAKQLNGEDYSITIAVTTPHNSGVNLTAQLKKENVNDFKNIEMNCIKKETQYHCTLSQLDIGTCYNILVYSVNNTVKSTIAANTTACTLPDHPKSVVPSISEPTSLTLIVTPSEKGFTDGVTINLYHFKKDINCQMENTTFTCSFHDLPPAACSDMSVTSMLNHRKSSSGLFKNICTAPSIPTITLKQKTTDTITVSLTNGLERIDSYDIYVTSTKNETEHFQSTTHEVNITDRIPGTMYQISVVAVANELRSHATLPLNEATFPSSPNVTLIRQTTNTITIIIKSGPGVVEHYDICVNNTKQRTELSISTTQEVNITDQIPGRMYAIVVVAVANNLNSSASIPLNVATFPSTPNVTLRGQTTDIIGITIFSGAGLVELYDIYVNGTKTNSEPFSSTTQEVNITNKIPGSMYEIVVVAVANNVNSSVTIPLNAATFPSSPNVTLIRQTTNTITITINSGPGVVEYYDIYVNGTKTNTELFNSWSQAVDITDRIPGKMYEIVVVAVANNLNSTASPPLNVATFPSSPIVTLTRQTTNTITIIIKSGAGVVEHYEIYVNGTKHQTMLINSTTQEVDITNRNPGTLYEIIAVSVANNLNSSVSSTLNVATFPSTPNVTFIRQTTNTITISIKRGEGLVEHYYVNVNGTKTNTAKFSSILQEIDITMRIPGTMYEIVVVAVFYNLNSNASLPLNAATIPSTPNVTFIRQTTNTITISIKRGEGLVERYYVNVNGTKTNTAKFSSILQEIDITTRIPGTMYEIVVVAVSYNLSSIASLPLNAATIPSTPNVTLIRQTTNTITISIKRGEGLVEHYYVNVNGTKTNTAKFSSILQEIDITTRIPGTMYEIVVVAVSYNLNSIASLSLNAATYPSAPDFQVTGYSSNSMNLSITHSGIVQRYLIMFKSANKSASCMPDEINQTVNVDGSPLMYTIGTLTPGAKYEIFVIAISNELTNSTQQTYTTDPSPPVFTYVKSSIHSIVLSVSEAVGCLDRYKIYVDGIFRTSVQRSPKGETRVEIADLGDHKDFIVNVRAISYGLESAEPKPLTASTNLDPTPAVGGALGAVAAIVVIICVVFVWRRQMLCFRKTQTTEVLDGISNKGFENKEHDDVEMSDSRRKRPVKLSEFSSHIYNMSRNSNMGLSQEFKDLGLLSPKHPSNISQLQENRPKNRYTNILPFDHSLVKLIAVEDEPGSDFISANYIEGYSGPREYIATQGPLPSTINDFWRMLWEQNASIVVMLTQLMERGKRKCDLYWPEAVSEKKFYGDIIVEIETQSFLPEYVLRTVVLRLGDIEKRVLHYNFLAWPDMGTPKSTDTMINFVDTVRKEVKPYRKGPIVVHCSAGVGRTGTFIAMDILLQQLRSGCTEVDIFGTIMKMRENRVNMVQTEDQYVFIYQCIRDFNEASDDEEENLYENQSSNQIYANVP